MLFTSKLFRATRMSKEEAYQGFLVHLSRFADSTKDSYSRSVRRFLNDSAPDLRDITGEDVENFILALHRTLKASSCNKILTGLKSFFKWLEDFRGMLNPTRNIKLLRQLPSKQRILSQEEYTKVVQATSGHRRDCIIFLANSGLRASEFLSLRNENIADGFITVLSTKTRKIRRVPINNNIRQILDTEPDFFNLSKNHNRKWLYKQTCKAAKQAGIPKFGPHSLRHYTATMMILKGIPRSVVARIIGDTVRTLDIVYTHLTDLDTVGVTDCLES